MDVGTIIPQDDDTKEYMAKHSGITITWVEVDGRMQRVITSQFRPEATVAILIHVANNVNRTIFGTALDDSFDMSVEEWQVLHTATQQTQDARNEDQ